MTNVIEESLQGVKAEIQDLEQKIKVAEGKTQTDYQDWLRDLCHAQKALQEELVGLREEGTARAPSPSTFPKDIPRQEEPATPTGHDSPRVSRSPSPWVMPPAVGDAKNVEEGVTELQPTERVQEAQVRFKVQHSLGNFFAKAWKARKAWK